MAALNGTNVDGRDLTVNERKPREGGSRGGFGGGGGGGGLTRVIANGDLIEKGGVNFSEVHRR